MADERHEACLRAWHSRPPGEWHLGFEHFRRDFYAAWDAAVKHCAEELREKARDAAEPTYHFLHGKKYKTDKAILRGMDVKALSGFDPIYMLYVEGTTVDGGDDPDRSVGDVEEIMLEGSVKRFYGVPPATGRR